MLPPGRKADDVFEQKIKGGHRIVYRTLSHAGGLLDGMRNRKEPLSGIDATHVASTLGMVAGIAARLGTKLKWDWRDERFEGNDDANRLLTRPMHNGWKLEA